MPVKPPPIPEPSPPRQMTRRAVGSLVVRALDSRPEGLGSILDVTKYPPSAKYFTCRNCGGGDRGRVAIYRPFGEVSLSLNRTVTCMVLKANDRRTSCPCHDEFRGPRSDYVRQGQTEAGRNGGHMKEYLWRNRPCGQKPTVPISVFMTLGTEAHEKMSHCQVIYSQFGLAIHQNDHQARRRFVEWAQNEIAVVPDFHKRILFSDEAHFWLNGYVNKQNCRIWSEANPQVYVKTPFHPEKLTVWCALWAGGIIGPYFFKNDEGHNVTVNGDRYRAMITIFFIPELNNHDVQEPWFQQDGATFHTARATIDLLKDTFGDRLISRFGAVNWSQDHVI
ncbi:putative DD41D transposase [Trichonephila clavipes]|nr:putative DD41D transposase [Trichonephila clavipes]